MVSSGWLRSLLVLGTLFFFTNMRAALADDVGWLASHQSGACAEAVTTGQGGGHGCGFLGWDCIANFLTSFPGMLAYVVPVAALAVASLALLFVAAPFALAAGLLIAALGLSVVETGALGYVMHRSGAL